MVVSISNKERIIGLFVKTTTESDCSYDNRRQEERSYFVRRVSMASDVVAEYTRVETLRMYEDFVTDLANFDKTPFKRRRWFSLGSLKILLG